MNDGGKYIPSFIYVFKMDLSMNSLIQLLYLCSSILFILSLRSLSSAATTERGNTLGICGMVIAIAATLFSQKSSEITIMAIIAIVIGGGIGTAVTKRIAMTSLPQLIAAFHSLVGCSAVLIAWTTFRVSRVASVVLTCALKKSTLFEIGLGTLIGAVTFTGSFVAFCKLHGLTNVTFRRTTLVNAVIGCICVAILSAFVVLPSQILFGCLVTLSLILGCTLILPVGGSDMPVVVSMLNSYSGWTAAATGFTLGNYLLIITGAIVGSSGAILSYIMCKNMNRSILKVIFGQTKVVEQFRDRNDRIAKIGAIEDAAFVLKNASSVIIVPGYGMAVAQAQRTLCEMAEILKASGVHVRYAIHPVAGRMPGHMNVLLAEANVASDDVFELDDINNEFAVTDVAFVVGANDITNPAAHNDPTSSIYGMPVFNVEKAGIVVFVKRSLGAGYAGIDNELFYRQNTMMIIGDAKKICESLTKYIKHI
jgi:NAD(P) transhydrogenase subunit beta